MSSFRTLHVFGEIIWMDQIDEEVGVRVLCGPDWTRRDEVTPPLVGVLGGFEFSLDHDIRTSISSWPRVEIVVGRSTCSILVPADPGTLNRDIAIKYVDAPWWTLGLCDILRFTVTMHLIAES